MRLDLHHRSRFRYVANIHSSDCLLLFLKWTVLCFYSKQPACIDAIWLAAQKKREISWCRTTEVKKKTFSDRRRIIIIATAFQILFQGVQDMICIFKMEEKDVSSY